MTGLIEGADYYIRVVAVNDAGPGAPGVTEPVTVKEPEGQDGLTFRRGMKRHKEIANCLILMHLYDQNHN